jgi:hypothetical protein
MHTPEKADRLRKWMGWLLVLFSLVSLGGILYQAPAMAPIKRGSSEDFWSIACRVELNPQRRVGGQAYVIDDRWFGYEVTSINQGFSFHGGTFHSVPAEEAMADFPRVLAQLEEAARNGVDSPVVRGFKQWRAKEPNDPPDVKRLLWHIKQEWFGKWMSRNDVSMCVYLESLEEAFHVRWQRSRWYWANIVFEWGFLTLLAWVAVWPLRNNRSPLWWGLVFALLPLLFLMPVYLGYARFTFTSAGPSGGILYPHLLVHFYHGSMNALDRTVLSYVPQLLEPISSPIGSALSLSGMGMPGPTSLLLRGGIVGLLVALARSAWVCRRDGIHLDKLGLRGWVSLLLGREFRISPSTPAPPC